MRQVIKIAIFFILLLSILSNNYISLKNEISKDNSLKFLNDEVSNKDQVIELIDHIAKFYSENSKDLNSVVCTSCQKLFDLLRSANYSIQKAVIRFISIEVCVIGKMYIRSVCVGTIDEMLNPTLDSFKNHYFDKDVICPFLRLCPRVYKKIDIQAYREEILQDKPQTPPPKSSSTPKKILKLLHVSDIHTDLEYKVGAPGECNEPICCRDESTGGKSSLKAGKWGSISHCDLPQRTVLKFVDFVNKNFNLDFSVWTGDNTSHDIWHQSYQRNEKNTKIITQLFKDKFNFTVYPTIGNHESFPVNVYDFFTKREIQFNNFFAHTWADWIGEEASLQMKKDAYYSTYNQKWNLKVISLNTHACNSQNWFLFRDPTDPGGMLKWLRNELYEAELNEKRVYIISHFPPHSCLEDFALVYDALLDRFSHTIRGNFVGHSHGAHLSAVRDHKTNKVVGVNLLPSSLTTYSQLQPSFRILDIDEQTMRPLNFYDYRLNLTKWNNVESEDIQWDLAYDFLKEYNLTDMSMESIEEFIEKLRKDQDTINKYNFNANSGVGSKTTNFTKNYYCDTFNVPSFTMKCNGGKVSTQDWLLDKVRGSWKERLK